MPEVKQLYDMHGNTCTCQVSLEMNMKRKISPSGRKPFHLVAHLGNTLSHLFE